MGSSWKGDAEKNLETWEMSVQKTGENSII